MVMTRMWDGRGPARGPSPPLKTAIWCTGCKPQHAIFIKISYPAAVRSVGQSRRLSGLHIRLFFAFPQTQALPCRNVSPDSEMPSPNQTQSLWSTNAHPRQGGFPSFQPRPCSVCGTEQVYRPSEVFIGSLPQIWKGEALR
jgi:hypothetical protein